MGSSVDHLIDSCSKLELARQITAQAKEIAELRDKVGKLEYDLFWRLASSNHKQDMEEASRYRWARAKENAGILQCILGQRHCGVNMDKAIDISRRTDPHKCQTCSGHGLVLVQHEQEWMSEHVWCPDCKGSGKKAGCHCDAECENWQDLFTARCDARMSKRR